MISQDEYTRIVLGTRMTLRALGLLIGDLPLRVDERRNIVGKIYSLKNDNHVLYMDLKDQGLVD